MDWIRSDWIIFDWMGLDRIMLCLIGLDYIELDCKGLPSETTISERQLAIVRLHLIIPRDVVMV